MSILRISIQPVRTTKGLEWYASLTKEFRALYEIGYLSRYGASRDEAVANLKKAFEEHRLKVTEERNLRQLEEEMEVDW